MGLTNNLGKLSNMITSTGSAVGIAQASPAFTLDVSGTLRNTTSAYFATASGNVGIGTTTATNKLTITNDGNAANALRINDTNANASFLSLSASNTDAAIIANGTAAIPLDIYTGGSARVRVSATGNVGIGTTSPVSTNLAGSLTIVKSYSGDTPTSTTAQTYYTNQSNLYLFGRNAGISIICPATSEEGSIFFGNSLSVAYASINTGSGTTSVGGDMNFRVGSNTTRMTITSAGNVGIGTTSPAYTLDVLSGAQYTARFNSSAAQGGFAAWANSGTAYGYVGNAYHIVSGGAVGDMAVAATANMVFSTGGSLTERMRITSGGDVTIGTTPTANGHNFFMASGNGAYQTIGHPNGTSTGYSYTIYYYNSGAIGGVSQSGTTAVVYNTTSDYRLKEVISPIQNSIDKILKLKPIHFKWKNTEDEYGDGFLAHELQEIIPLAVTGEKDALNEDGTYKLQQVDHSKLVPVLVKAMQEQNQLITSLQDRLDKAGL